jgi:hypothetical protein
MKGTVLAYSTAASAGVIRNDNGNTFYFIRADWSSETLPSADASVTFAPSAGVAKKIVFHRSSKDRAA